MPTFLFTFLFHSRCLPNYFFPVTSLCWVSGMKLNLVFTLGFLLVFRLKKGLILLCNAKISWRQDKLQMRKFKAKTHGGAAEPWPLLRSSCVCKSKCFLPFQFTMFCKRIIYKEHHLTKLHTFHLTSKKWHLFIGSFHLTSVPALLGCHQHGNDERDQKKSKKTLEKKGNGRKCSLSPKSSPKLRRITKQMTKLTSR